MVLEWMEDLFLHRTSSNPKEMLSVVAYNMGEELHVCTINIKPIPFASF